MNLRKIIFRALAAVITAVLLISSYQVQQALAQIPANVRVGLITPNSASQYRNARSVAFTVKGNYQVLDLSAIPGENIIGTPGEGETWEIYYLPSGLQVYQNGQSLKITSGPVVISETTHDLGNFVTLNSYSAGSSSQSINKRYRGNMEFRSNGSSVTVINELPMDEYLWGVVPREMSNSWPLEALKAQALAARTYTVANYNKRAADGYNMFDTPTDQAYGGISAEGANATRAVQETSGKVILFDGKPISAVYHSNSGGHTEDNENVWTGGATAYLRGKPDPYSTKQGLANWTYSTTIEDVRSKLVQNGSRIGTISDISLEKYSSGRVKTVMITDINGNNITMSGSEFGKLFNPKFYTYISDTSFMSNYFDVEMDDVSAPGVSVINGARAKTVIPGSSLYAVSDDGTVDTLNGGDADFYAIGAEGSSAINNAAAGQVTFKGHGWGHGVGMSQWGAYEMASQGMDCEAIIRFYYSGVEIGS